MSPITNLNLMVFFFTNFISTYLYIILDLTTLRLVLFLLGKFGISMVVTSLYLYTTELYPTQYRHSLLGFSSMVGRIGSITAPLTPVLVIQGVVTPLITHSYYCNTRNISIVFSWRSYSIINNP